MFAGLLDSLVRLVPVLAVAALSAPAARAQSAPPPADTGRPITILVTAAVGDGGVKDAEVIVLYWEDLKKDWGEMRITPIFSDWDEATLRDILAGNAARVYGFDLDALAPFAAECGPTVDEVATSLEQVPDDATSPAFTRR